MYFQIYILSYQLLNFHVIFLLYGAESPLQIRKSLSWFRNPRNFLNSTRRLYEFFTAPILCNLVQATLSQSNQSGTSVKPTRLNKILFHEFYNIGYLVCLHFCPLNCQYRIF